LKVWDVPKTCRGFSGFFGEVKMEKVRNLVLVFLASFGLLAAPVHAADLSDLTSAINFSDVSTAVMTVAAALATIYVLWKGASLILRAIRGL
jgi:hypothetical protein